MPVPHLALAFPHVAILLCTYDGARFLPEQLDSIETQRHVNWTVWASDDGSSDASRQILQRYQDKWGEDRLRMLDGPRKGSAANFLALLCNSTIRADLYAYADQDDVWLPEKLARAVEHLTGVPAGQPALYGSRTRLISETGQPLGESAVFRRPPGFRNALVQNIFGGNTMVFNDAAREIVSEPGPGLALTYHDWWTYVVVTGVGGCVCYDLQPTMLYRQHGNNVLGANVGWGAKLKRLGMLLRGDLGKGVACNVAGLRLIARHLTDENRHTLETFVRGRAQWWLPRQVNVWRSGVYRQSFLDDIALALAVALGKL